MTTGGPGHRARRPVALAAATLAALPLAGALPAAAAAPITVCPAGCDHTSIQAAINAAASGATIVIGAGTYDGPLTIDTSLTLPGADNSAQIRGGGIYNDARATLTADDGAIGGNTAAGHGGGLFNLGPSATFTGSTVTGNTAG